MLLATFPVDHADSSLFRSLHDALEAVVRWCRFAFDDLAERVGHTLFLLLLISCRRAVKQVAGTIMGRDAPGAVAEGECVRTLGKDKLPEVKCLGP